MKMKQRMGGGGLKEGEKEGKKQRGKTVEGGRSGG